MIIEVKVPVFSESISEGTLLTWYKTKGDTWRVMKCWQTLKPTK